MKKVKINEYISLKLFPDKLEPVVRIYVNNESANSDFLRARKFED